MRYQDFTVELNKNEIAVLVAKNKLLTMRLIINIFLLNSVIFPI